MIFFIKHKTITTFTGFTLFCLIALSVQSSSPAATIEGIGSGIVTPFQKIYHGVQSSIGRFWAGFTELTEVREELSRTQEKLRQYEAVSEDLHQIRRENERLRRLLELPETSDPDFIPAKIISKDPDNWFRTIIINRGSNSGIKINMPVIAYRGGRKAVVGKVIEARYGASRILPITSADIKLGVKIQNNGYPGILSGFSSNSNQCVMDYVSREAEIKHGDIIVTSGQAGIFPEGIAVGTAITAGMLETSSFQRVIIEPIIDYNLLEEVFVIKREPDRYIMELLEAAE